MYPARPRESTPFDRRLESFLLGAYARGVDVEGEWYMARDDPVLSELRGTISAVGTGPSVATPRTGEHAFASEFETFLLREFASGTDIEGSWSVYFARETLPTWEVDIEFRPVERDRLPTSHDGA